MSRIFFWFTTGVLISSFLIGSFAFILFEKSYQNVVYPGISIENVDLSKKTQSQVKDYFVSKNREIASTNITFSLNDYVASASAGDLDIGYDQDLLSAQAISLGRSSDPISNLSIILQAYFLGINLTPSYHFSTDKLNKLITPISTKVNKDPVDALFQFNNGRVDAFRPSVNGEKVDIDKLSSQINDRVPNIIKNKPKNVLLAIPVSIIQPQITTEKVNNLGIKELIGSGTSLFQHSIPNRIYNVNLASGKINGVLVAPNEVFSFDQAIGDVTSLTGYKQAYVIQNGKTVLGDGGGVCQVSTTFFRALLNAGLPIVERTAHAYRVGYYEEDSPPGIDATIFYPSVDLKFKNDTNNWILIQTIIDPSILRLTVDLYGTKDGRISTISKPVITNQSPPPPPLYQDDPTLPNGTIKQVDFEAWGANVYFTRRVTKNGKEIINERFNSNYRPWQAVFLKGTG